MACHVQVGSAASLEWIVVGLTTGPIRGCLKPSLEFVFSETRWALLLLGLSWGVGSVQAWSGGRPWG